MPKGDKLQPKQVLFIKHYLSNWHNATQAYVSAWYSWKNADVCWPQLLGNPRVRVAIDKALEVINSKLDFDWIRVLKQIKEIGQRCMQKVPVMYYDKEDKVFKQQMKDWEGVRTFDSSWANTAFANLGRHFKLFTDKTENENTNNNISEPSDDDIDEAM